jgi:putative methionine-R-sulfoxide reductase with GAF domain
MRFPGEDGGKSLAEMAQRDLVATLQLLAERAQYITGATGSAIALRDGAQMVCRASAGTSAPEVGTQLQVNSGLSGESVRTRQTLRCDDAATDPRVNRESCEALGIASVVVMPLVQGDEVIGVFELFSDKANVFDGRDITALERMGAMVFTALEQARSGLASGSQQVSTPAEGVPAAKEAREAVPGTSRIAFHMRAPVANPASELAVGETEPPPEVTEPEDVLDVAMEAIPAAASEIAMDEPLFADLAEPRHEVPPGDSAFHVGIDPQELIADPQPVPFVTTPLSSAVASLRRCEGCGFPVSEGRQLCLDCEKKKAREPHAAANASHSGTDVRGAGLDSTIPPTMPQEAPLFLGEDAEEASWLSSHKYMLGAIAVAVVGIVALLLAR